MVSDSYLKNKDPKLGFIIFNASTQRLIESSSTNRSFFPLDPINTLIVLTSNNTSSRDRKQDGEDSHANHKLVEFSRTVISLHHSLATEMKRSAQLKERYEAGDEESRTDE